MDKAVEYAELPDARLRLRLDRIVEQLSGSPEQSIPQVFGDASEVKAVYRFLGQ